MRRANAKEARAPARIPVWDWPVRLLHWSLAALVGVDLVRDDGDYEHRMIGYAALVVVVVRLSWACLSRSHGRISALRPSVRESLTYVKLLVRGRPPRSLGHDPLGLWMIWLLWTLVALLGVTGWMTRLDAFWGDDGIRSVHAFLADLLLLAIVGHLAGVLTMSLLWRENLPASMITGRKRSSDISSDKATLRGYREGS
ncbi:MAG: cytochrome b/b6 domain-containing protein [Reyranella sp.]|nr:cytochrome b/b6 domain-containing protein [Reyranella sp.]